MLALYHNHGAYACGGVAWWQEPSNVKAGAHFCANDIQKPDGTAPQSGDSIRCGSCGHVFSFMGSDRPFVEDYATTRLIGYMRKK